MKRIYQSFQEIKPLKLVFPKVNEFRDINKNVFVLTNDLKSCR